MSGRAQTKYPIDLVFVIDVTGSMGDVLNNVKAMAINFEKELNEEMNLRNKSVESLRVRVVSFRDLGEEGLGAISTTQFFNLPTEEDSFRAVLDSLDPLGGGDEAESGLEALWVAIRSPWRKAALKSRHIIVMFTDASAHELGKFPFKSLQDAIAVPKTLGEMQGRWGDAGDPGLMNVASKRLVLFAPDAYPWNEIGESWENTNWFPSQAGNGCAEIELKQIIQTVAGSV